MAASIGELHELHRMITKSMTERIRQDLEDNVPTDAATLGAITKFLKDNNVSADPADKEDLKGLQNDFMRLRQEREARKKKQLELAADSLKVMEG